MQLSADGFEEDVCTEQCLHENDQSSIMPVAMVQVIQASEDDQSNSTDKGEKNREERQDLLEPRGIWCKPSLMSEPSLGNEYHIETDDCHGTHSDEQGLQLMCADIRNVSSGLSVRRSEDTRRWRRTQLSDHLLDSLVEGIQSASPLSTTATWSES